MKTFLTILAFALFLNAGATGSGNFSLVEINPAHGTQSSLFSFPDSSKLVYGAGELSSFTEMNGKMYFSARNAYNMDELWSTDGTQQGTSMVKDINPNGSAGIGNIVKVGNRILFMAADNNNNDYDLWSSDGTEGGTEKVLELGQNSNIALNPENISAMGNRLLFCTSRSLLVTDGTAGGTDSLLSISAYVQQGFGYCELNNKVYFILPNSNGKQELWRTDGTGGGTELALNLSDADSVTGVTQMAAFDGKMYVIASRNWGSYDLFTFDGAVGGQWNRIVLAPGSNSYPQHLTLFNGALYFTASTMTSANVFRINAGNPTPQELVTNANFTAISNLTFANNSAYFTTGDQVNIHRIDLGNLNHSVTTLQGQFVPYYFQDNGMLAGFGGKVFMSLYDSATQNQIFVEADETLQNITEIMPGGYCTPHPFNFLAGCGTADIFDFKVWNDKLLVPANFTDAGRELWVFSPSDVANGVVEAKNEPSFSIYPNPANKAFTVSSNNNGYCDQQLEITNVAGAVVMQTTLQSGLTSINIATLPAGNYCVSLLENGKATGTQKLVVNK